MNKKTYRFCNTIASVHDCAIKHVIWQSLFVLLEQNFANHRAFNFGSERNSILVDMPISSRKQLEVICSQLHGLSSNT